jgi:hypothetical protein
VRCPRSPLFFAPGILALSVGCRDLGRFSTAEGQAYCGSLVAAPPPGAQGFLPPTLPPSLGMRLTLDAAALNSVPGRITTDDANRGFCSPQPLFTDAALRAVSEAEHDPISLLEFGDGREYNGLVWVDSVCRGTMVGVLSLMKSGKVELRLFKPGASDAPPSDREGFAHFDLTRRDDRCGF